MTSRISYPTLQSPPYQEQHKELPMMPIRHHFDANLQCSPAIYDSKSLVPPQMQFHKQVSKCPSTNVIGIIYVLYSCSSSFLALFNYALLSMAIYKDVPIVLASMASSLFMIYFWFRCLFDRKYLAGKPGLAKLWPIVFNIIAWVSIMFTIDLNVVCNFLSSDQSNPNIQALFISIQASHLIIVLLGCVTPLFDYFVFSRDDEDDSCCLFLKPFVMRPVESDSIQLNVNLII